MNALHIAAGVVAASALIAATLAIPKSSNPITIEPPKFEDSWRDTAVPLSLAPRIIPLDAPKVIKTEVIPVTPEVITQADISVPVTRKPKETREPKPERDLCRGKGKRYTHNGKSWRCRR